MFSFQLFQNLKNLMNPYRVAFESPLELSAQGNFFLCKEPYLPHQPTSFHGHLHEKAALSSLKPYHDLFACNHL